MTAANLNAYSSAASMLEALRDRRISSTELLDGHLRRIARFNPRLNAIVTPNYDDARAAAWCADQVRERRESEPELLGLPLTIKDCIYVKGLATTGGVPARAGKIDEQDAPVAASVRAAGAAILGKTNVPPYASDWQSNNPVFGRSNNPWNLDRTPGGSTGGGAAAVAAGLTPLEFGGDFAGSIRVPAAFCGIYGHKPSLTAVPQTGHFPAGLLPNRAASLAVLGPLARTAEDLELAFDVIAGPDVGEDAGWQVAIPSPRHERLADFRVAILPVPNWLPVQEEILEAQRRLAQDLERICVRVAEIQPEGFEDLREYYKVYLAVVAAIESTGLRGEKRARLIERLRASGDEMLEDGYVRGVEGTASDLVMWHAMREEYRSAYRSFFREWDVLIAPANLVVAFPHDDRPFFRRELDVDGRRVYYGRQSFFAGLANLSGQPSTAFPVGRTKDGLPIGLQAIGPYLEDRTTMRFTGLAGGEFGGFVPPPGYEADFD